MPKRNRGPELDLADIRHLKSEFPKFLTGASKSSYSGGFVKLGGTDSPGSVSASHKKEVNRIGRLHGCHTCGKPPNDVWITDHIPPKELTDTQVKSFWPNWDRKYRFYAQCKSCSSKQSEIVKKIKSGKIKAPLSDKKHQKMICDDVEGISINGQNGGSSNLQRADIQDIGDAKGCHSCGKKSRVRNSYLIMFHRRSLVRTICNWRCKNFDCECRPGGCAHNVEIAPTNKAQQSRNCAMR